MTGSNGLPLVPYMRQSRAKERTISIEEQRRDIQAWARTNGVSLAPEVIEQNVSGSKPWRERALGRAVEMCERSEAGGIIVAWQDRLSRENGRATAEVWEALEACNARLICANEGLDTASGDHKLSFSIKAAIARDQWKRHRANWERAKRNAAERGVASGRAPIGYRKSRGQPFQLDRRNAAKVREAFELRANGVSLSAIARRFSWSHSTTRQILKNPVYTGVLIQGDVRKENAHPAIVSQELFEAANAAKRVQAVPPGDTTRDLLLIGLVRCAGCGRTLKPTPRTRGDGSKVQRYYCRDAASDACPDRALVGAVELDTFVDEWFTEAIRGIRQVVDVIAVQRELEQAQAEQRTAEKRLAAFLDSTEFLDAIDYHRAYEAHKRRVSEAREQVGHLAARLPHLPESGQPLWALWDGFDVLRRRAILLGALDRIVVHRGASAGLEGHVQIHWQDGSLAFPEVTDDANSVGVVAA